MKGSRDGSTASCIVPLREYCGALMTMEVRLLWEEGKKLHLGRACQQVGCIMLPVSSLQSRHLARLPCGHLQGLKLYVHTNQWNLKLVPVLDRWAPAANTGDRVSASVWIVCY